MSMSGRWMLLNAVAVVAAGTTFLSVRVLAHAGLDHAALSAIVDHTSDYRTQAASIIETARNGSTFTSEARKNNCENADNQLNKEIQNSSLLAAEYVSKLDAIYAAAQDYYKIQGLSISDYDLRLNAVSAAQNVALVDTGVMAVLNRPIKCNNSSPASDVVAFRLAAKVASESIDVYRNELIGLLEAVKASALSARDTGAAE